MQQAIRESEEALLRDIQNGGAVSLERALLALSGMKSVEEIRSYQRKIDDIFGRFAGKWGNESLSKWQKPPPYLHRSIAKFLFDYLWSSKPKRFGDRFLLTDVVDAQLDPDVHRVVGTCVGLTSLYSVLGLRAGLSLSLLAGSGHLLSRLRVGEQAVDIDHTDPLGFDCRNCADFRELPLLTLIANVLNSRGLSHERGGNFAAAKADYEKAILANPQYANAYNNRGNIRFRDADMPGAVADYTEAIRLDPSLCEAYCNRGIARQELGLYDEARRDYATALSTNSQYGDARNRLLALDEIKHNGPRAAAPRYVPTVLP